ncbi:hypothetical protein TH63_09495 [Rufibacter radiotolerans]|uniref:Protein CR006 P-loop domain-containing protein n=1 Tax=Rufibacter radiotolerans TaxID=1379910 RepID=A0A0H4VQK1_9BACT|nr:hypothetical protein TH63_09495 [Rufibacter radiotolerans]
MLTKLQKVQGVNALVENQVLDFSPNVTIVYGINGSGKSSYVRLLKKAFVNKAADEPILPNVHFPSGHKEVKAGFSFSSTGEEYTLNYPDDCTQAEFHQFSVFDNKCAPVHLNNKNSFIFKPAGLCLFSDLIEAVKKVEEKISAEILLRTAKTDFTSSYDGTSEIKTLLAELSAKTNIETLRNYTPYTAEDKTSKRIAEEKKASLMLLKIDEKIADLNEKREQVETLKAAVATINRCFTAEQLIKAQTAINDCLVKEATAKKDGIENFKSDKIKDIGSVEWKAFIEAAESFAKKQVIEPLSYPSIDDNCLFCHQSLSEDAQKLVSNYWSFIKSQAEQDAKTAQAALGKAISVYEKINFNLLPDDNTITVWLSKNHSEKLISFKNSITTQQALCQDIISDITLKAANSHEEYQIDVDGLELIITDIDRQVKELNKKDPKAEIAEFDKQLDFLNHKEKLPQQLGAIEVYIKNLQWAAIATSNKSKIGKKKITDSEKQLSDKYFNQAYINAFNRISKELNGNFGVEINHTGVAGSSFRQLSLRGKQPSQILSEGEQKVIALADYLAEMELSIVNKGIIFDDPVTSLDNERKKQIADCLTKESKKRQVIIFTHDLVFFYHLKNFAKKHLSEMPNSFIHHSLIKDETKLCGKVIMNFSPANEGQYTDATKATEWLNKSKRVPDEEKLDCIKSGYSAIRASYEALAIFIIMGGVVQRFDPQIRMGRLKEVKFDKSLINKVIEKHGEISDLIEGHLPSDEFGITPDADMLDLQIQEFITLKEEFKKIRLN